MIGARLRQKLWLPILIGIFVPALYSGCVKHTEGYQSVKLSTDIPTPVKTSGRNPVIVIHGLFGSELYSADGEKLWGQFSNLKIRNKSILRQLAFAPLRVGSVMERAEITPGSVPVFHLENYILLIDALKKFGYSKDEIMIFSYDWRQSVPENAALLHEFILEKEKQSGKKLKFDIIAHSMGGLITRYYMLYGNHQLPVSGLPIRSDKGAEKLENIFIFGTPNRGYADTVIELCNGLVFVRGAAKYPQALLGNFASYFCMMPPINSNAFVYSDNGEKLDIYDIETWKKLDWGLAAEKTDNTFFHDQKTAMKKLSYNLRTGRQFARAMNVPLAKRNGVRLYLFAGNAFPTVRKCTVNRRTGGITVKEYGPGDGKILLESAITDNLVPWDAIYVFGAAHMGLFTSNDAMRNLAFLLDRSNRNE